MPVTIGWPEIALRLALAVLGGAVLGLNRTERGVAAGLRTTLLVCLAAAVSMIQVNLLLGTAGRAGDSFVMMDLMRLPLGVLTGMGFIGGGAILRRGDIVTGVTTAATLWLATVLGLCFGAGQHGLGLATLGIGAAVLWALKGLEALVRQQRRAELSLTAAEGGPGDEEVRSALEAAGFRVFSWDVAYARGREPRARRVRAVLFWRGRVGASRMPECVRHLTDHPGVLSLRWKV